MSRNQRNLIAVLLAVVFCLACVASGQDDPGGLVRAVSLRVLHSKDD